jgi:anaerobic magnesium-protoporphyrin IX monomethyl ester cyclase
MKILVGYAPLKSDKGVPLLSQNRQFQWFSKPTYVYPMVPASTATLLKSRGHDVYWIDGIAEGLTPEQFRERYRETDAEIFLLETKTPVIKMTWQIVDELKELLPSCRIVLCGDHVTAMPEETLENSSVDYVLCGGDYDFSLAGLVESIENGTPVPAGFWWRDEDGTFQTSGKFDLGCNDLNELPPIDRELTQWKLYSTENGNFRRTPGTYTMAGRDCWWGKCDFCSWTTIFPQWRTRSVEKVLDEIGDLIERYGIKEIFDDSGTFPAGKWLREFCDGMIERGYNKRVVLGCNMIPGVLAFEQYNLMAKAGFKFVLFGLESASEKTLERINKCPAAKNVEESMRLARKAGLRPHVTCMVGYPWESYEDAKRTVELTRSLFNRGWIDTLQGTIVIPYPGTPLFDDCRKNGWLRTEDWDRYDMREPIMKTNIPDEEIFALIRKLYTSFLTPKFIFRQLLSIRSMSDIAYLWKAGLRVLGHLFDFHGHASK